MNIKTFIFSILASYLAILILVNSSFAEDAGPQALLQTTHRDLGRVRSDSEINHTFDLRNAGLQPLKISDVRLSGGGLSARLPQEILPGETGKIELSINAKELVGDWNWKILFGTNDKTKKIIEFTLRGYVFPPVEVAPAPAVFFSIFHDETSTRKIKVLNHTERALVIERVEIIGSHFSADLKVEEVGKIFALDITVPESVPPGRYREALLMRTNHPSRPTIRIPVNVLVKRDIFVFPEAIGFGQVNLQKIRNAPALLQLLTQTHTVTHRRGEFAIAGITTDIPFLKIEKTPAGRSKIFKLDVKLDPEKLVPGRISGAITLQTDDPRFPEITVPVSGEIR